MPTLKITIKMDNAAFGEVPNEVQGLLEEITERLSNSGVYIGLRFAVLDSNGNTVGEAKVTR
jgi:protocatechuate 3,4-dioxygenase beta subunit